MRAWSSIPFGMSPSYQRCLISSLPKEVDRLAYSARVLTSLSPPMVFFQHEEFHLSFTTAELVKRVDPIVCRRNFPCNNYTYTYTFFLSERKMCRHIFTLHYQCNHISVTEEPCADATSPFYTLFCDNYKVEEYSSNTDLCGGDYCKDHIKWQTILARILSAIEETDRRIKTAETDYMLARHHFFYGGPLEQLRENPHGIKLNQELETLRMRKIKLQSYATGARAKVDAGHAPGKAFRHVALLEMQKQETAAPSNVNATFMGPTSNLDMFAPFSNLSQFHKESTDQLGASGSQFHMPYETDVGLVNESAMPTKSCTVSRPSTSRTPNKPKRFTPDFGRMLQRASKSTNPSGTHGRNRTKKKSPHIGFFSVSCLLLLLLWIVPP